MTDKTIQFKLQGDRDQQLKAMLAQVYDALAEKGYNPVSQIVGYIISEDPTYITTYNNARNIIMKIDRYELLQSLIKDYLGVRDD
ncbi:MAG: IreB family regulatory phosphoprotein [Clostridiales bacterium]|nr:IreB family regulatory phosphoprotein [Clostridiales bacterium]